MGLAAPTGGTPRPVHHVGNDLWGADADGWNQLTVGGGGSSVEFPQWMPATFPGFCISAPIQAKSWTLSSLRTLIGVPVLRTPVTFDALRVSVVDGVDRTQMQLAIYDDVGQRPGLDHAGGYPGSPIRTTGDLDISGLVASTGVKYDALITPLTIATPQMLWCGCRFEGTGSAPTMMIADNGQHQNYGAWPNGEYVADSNTTTNIGAGFVWNGGGTGWEDPFGGGRSWARFPVHVGLRVAS